MQLWPQHGTMDRLREAWREADALGVDSLWVWDHFFPLYGPQDGAHFECWSLLAAMAADTSHATVGPMVSCVTYRNPDLLADIARTVDHVSGGRVVLGLGSGWFRRDYEEYGYPFADAPARQRILEESIARIRARLPRLVPPPGPRAPGALAGRDGGIPLLIGSGGERRGLRIVAENADAWNWFGTPEEWSAKSRVLDEWCGRVGRDPRAIERSVLLDGRTPTRAEDYAAAGCDHVIVGVDAPYDLTPVRDVLARLRS